MAARKRHMIILFIVLFIIIAFIDVCCGMLSSKISREEEKNEQNR